MQNHFDMNEEFDINSIEDINYGSFINVSEDHQMDETAALQRAVDDIRKIVRIARTGRSIQYIYKSINNSGNYTIEIMSNKDAKDLFESVKIKGLKKVKIGGQMRELTIWRVIQRFPEKFRVKRFAFYSDDQNVFNTFSGYAINPAETIDESLIQHHLNHWKNILCSGKEDQFIYLIKWCARLLKVPNCTNKTALILLSKQGTGKNTFFTDHLIKIIGNTIYSCYENNSNNVFGQFNKKVENKHLIVLNEATDATESTVKTISYDRLKSLLTDMTISIRPMRTDPYDVDNVANLIIVSNNAMPFRIEDNDRRCIYLDVSNKYAAPEIGSREPEERTAYFNELMNEMSNPQFLPTLYAYLLSQYDETWNSETMKPQYTERKEAIAERSSDPLEDFVEENILEFSKHNNWDGLTAFNEYLRFCKERNHTRASSYKKFIADLKEKYYMVNVKSGKLIGGKRPVYIYLTDEGINKYKSLIDETQALREASHETEYEDVLINP